MLSNYLWNLIAPRMRQILDDHDAKMDIWLEQNLGPKINGIFTAQLDSYKDKIADSTTEIAGKYFDDHLALINELKSRVAQIQQSQTILLSEISNLKEKTIRNETVGVKLKDWFDNAGDSLKSVGDQIGDVLKAMEDV